MTSHHPIFLKRLIYNQFLTWKYASGKVKKYRTGGEKSKFEIIKELTSWQINEREFNWLYYAMGLNLAGTKQHDYIGRKTFLTLKNSVEYKLKTDAKTENLNYDVITKDKFYLSSILSQNSMPCIKNLAVFTRGKIILHDGGSAQINELKNFGTEFIFKNITLEAGEGVLNCEIKDDTIVVNGDVLSLNEFIKKLGLFVWVIQAKHHSHPAIQKINSSALNTTRIVTIVNKDEPEYLTGFQGFAVNNAKTDSWSGGSIYVGIIPEQNKLKAEGFTSPSDKRAGIQNHHPDSKIDFKDYPIPHLHEAVELCKRAHRLLYFNFIVGWDVAITNDGPFILEANEKPGMNVAQCVDGGLRKRILETADNFQK